MIRIQSLTFQYEGGTAPALKDITLPDGRSLPVTEIRSRIRGAPTLTIVWYTGPKETVGSFYAFRRKWSPSQQWFSFQAATEVYNGNEEAARNFLLTVLSKF